MKATNLTYVRSLILKRFRQLAGDPARELEEGPGTYLPWIEIRKGGPTIYFAGAAFRMSLCFTKRAWALSQTYDALDRGSEVRTSHSFPTR